MKKLNIFQRNCLVIGTHLAMEKPAFANDLRSFVVIGAYMQTSRGPAKASNILNKGEENLRFWLRAYEVHKYDIDKYLTDSDLVNSIYIDQIQSIEQLEKELEKYVPDLALMQVTWKVENPLP